MCTDDGTSWDWMYGNPIPGSEKVEIIAIRMKRCARCGKLLPQDNQNKFEMDDGSTVDVCIECAIWLAHNAPEKQYFYSIR